MIVFPNCKINLGLLVTGKRPDGYHDIDTVFFPLPLKDALEVLPAHGTPPSEDLQFTSTGIATGDPAKNLCVKAYYLLKQRFPSLPACRMHLHKALPVGAGLGGGSGDGSFALRVLNEQFGLQLDSETLAALALELGSDCPFFILNQPAHATGRGERLRSINLSLTGYDLLIVNPGIHVNTGWAFAQPGVIGQSAPSPGSIVEQPIASWRDTLINAFEPAVFAAHPPIAALKEQLYAAGAIYAGMSGTGSTVYGFFEPKRGTELAFPSDYWHRRISL